MTVLGELSLYAGYKPLGPPQDDSIFTKRPGNMAYKVVGDTGNKWRTEDGKDRRPKKMLADAIGMRTASADRVHGHDGVVFT